MALGGGGKLHQSVVAETVEKRVADLRFTACSRVAMGSRHVREEKYLGKFGIIRDFEIRV